MVLAMKRRPLLALPFVLTTLISPAFADEAPPPPAKKKKLPKPGPNDHIIRDPDGTCRAVENRPCPPNVHCNPPPPREVECPPEKETKKK